MLLGAACSTDNRIASREDYQHYLSTELLPKDSDTPEVSFWTDRLERMPADEASIAKLAALYAERFKEHGEIKDIRKSDSLFSWLLVKTDSSAEVLQALATNAITQHQFKKALRYIDEAVQIGNKRAASFLILSDVSLELADHFTASLILKNFTNKNSFPFLIRQAKLKDNEGKLDTAILLMEQAHQRVDGNQELTNWTLSNLADMYGHAGRVKDAYANFLKVLQNDPSDDYALKGIAWIVLSHDRNTREAKSIARVLASRKQMPEAHLLLAEIAEMEGDRTEKIVQLEKFVQMVSRPGYKRMYHKYLALIAAEELGSPAMALEIAEDEILNRSTPQSYDLKAWALYHLKDYKNSLAIAQQKVEGRTYEPEPIYHLGMIYLANGDVEKATKYLQEALTSEFELGPSVSATIKQALKTI